MSDAPHRGDGKVPSQAGAAGTGATAPVAEAASKPGEGRTGAPPHASASGGAPVRTGEANPPKDIVLLGPPTADGGGVHVLRARAEQLEAGELRTLQEGKPIVGEIVTLKPREGDPRVCDVTSSYAPPSHPSGSTPRLGHKGPAKVATSAYRAGWDEIFGNRDDASDGRKRDLN